MFVQGHKLCLLRQPLYQIVVRFLYQAAAILNNIRGLRVRSGTKKSSGRIGGSETLRSFPTRAENNNMTLHLSYEGFPKASVPDPLIENGGIGSRPHLNLTTRTEIKMAALQSNIF